MGPAREDSLGAGGLARHGEGLGFGHGDDLVEVLGTQHRRPAPDAAPLDVVGSWGSPRQDRRFLRLHHHPVQREQLDGQRARLLPRKQPAVPT
jgi:hypothetical protein